MPSRAVPGNDACAAMSVGGSGAWPDSPSADQSPESKLTLARSRVEPRNAPTSRPGSLGAQQIEHRSPSGCIVPGPLPRLRLHRRLAHGTSRTSLPSFLRAARPPHLLCDQLPKFRKQGPDRIAPGQATPTPWTKVLHPDSILLLGLQHAASAMIMDH